MTSHDVVEATSVSGPPPSSAKHPAASGTRLAWLDVLRGLAALAVALYFAHFGSIRGEDSDPTTSVLSQLLMMSNVLEGKNLPNVVWSLSYEMVFYLLLTALFITRAHKRSSC